MSTIKRLEETKNWVQKHFPQIQPHLGIILGSGLGNLIEMMDQVIQVPYSDIPNFFPTQVKGHLGQMVFGYINRIPSLILQGRFHLYEGHNIKEVSFPAQFLCSMGIKGLILTNAAGIVNPCYQPGQLMLIQDHLNLMGTNPLIGDSTKELGNRFLDLSEAYSNKGNQILKDEAKKLNIHMHSGTYAALAGPSYETAAEIKMLQILGADAVGMSTVPETLVAKQMGVPVVGLSCLTNFGAGLGSEPLSHEDVLKSSKFFIEKLKKLIFSCAPSLLLKC